MRKTALIFLIAPMLVAAALLGDALPDTGMASAQTATTDYDDDNDGLIDVKTLAQLNAVRHDLNGNGDATHADYIAAFPSRDTSPTGRMGCPSGEPAPATNCVPTWTSTPTATAAPTPTARATPATPTTTAAPAGRPSADTRKT